MGSYRIFFDLQPETGRTDVLEIVDARPWRIEPYRSIVGGNHLSQALRRPCDLLQPGSLYGSFFF